MQKTIKDKSMFENLDSEDRKKIHNVVKNTACSRRRILKVAFVAGISISAASRLISDANLAHSSSPKKGGSVRMAANWHGPDDQLDPSQFVSEVDYARGRATYNGLVQFGDNLSLNPELAESFEPNKNATEWNFFIRKGVEFHDGSRLTADDVVYSMNRHLGENSTSVIKSLMFMVSEWKKVGPHEVKAILSRPYADFPNLLGIYQAKIVKAGTTGDGIGTGPFLVESFEPGVKSFHKRNENYWREGPNLDSIEITAISDPYARVNALLSGDIDLATMIDPKYFRRIESSTNATLLSRPSATQLGICCLRDVAPGDSDDFVKAIKYSQDRERIVSKILKGRGTIGNDHPVSSAHGFDFCSELPQRNFDLDKADYHFRKSGFSSAEIFVAPIAPGIEEIVQLTQENCRRIGFDLRIRKVPTEGYWGAVWKNEPLNVTTWNTRPTAHSQIAIQFAPDAQWNDSNWFDAGLGALLKRSASETSPDRRKEMMCDMQSIIHNHSGMVIPAFANMNDGIKRGIYGIPRVSLGSLGSFEWPEFAWIN